MGSEKLVEMPIGLAQEICEALVPLQNHLNVKNWSVDLRQAVSFHDEYAAHITPVGARHKAVLVLCDGWFDDDHQQKTHMLCHELLHLTFAEQDQEIESLLKHNLSPVQLEAANDLIALRQEFIVDDLAVAFAALLPKSTITLLEKLYKKLDRWWKTVD